MLCPAVLDPFEGPYYRLWATAHQSLLCPVLGKILCLLANFFLTQFPMTKVKPTLDYPIMRKEEDFVKSESQLMGDGDINGRTHID